ncbi:MAG: serine/threonine-protein kinase, partial [Candidatus Xenobia bacterium]
MLQPGVVLQKRYEVVKTIARGHLGPIYLAVDRKRQQQFTLKEVELETFEAPQQIAAEARMLASLSHPHLVHVYEPFEHEGRLYIPVERVEADSLATVVRRLVRSEEFLPLPQILAWGDILADVLEYLHGHDPALIYRYLKPANVRLDSHQKLWLAELDVARVGDRDRNSTTAVALTPGYSPIEQYTKGTSGPGMDIYALGATLYHLMTKEAPPAAVDRVLGTTELIRPSSRNPAVTRELDEVIRKMLAIM